VKIYPEPSVQGTGEEERGERHKDNQRSKKKGKTANSLEKGVAKSTFRGALTNHPPSATQKSQFWERK